MRRLRHEGLVPRRVQVVGRFDRRRRIDHGPLLFAGGARIPPQHFGDHAFDRRTDGRRQVGGQIVDQGALQCQPQRRQRLDRSIAQVGEVRANIANVHVGADVQIGGLHHDLQATMNQRAQVDRSLMAPWMFEQHRRHGLDDRLVANRVPGPGPVPQFGRVHQGRFSREIRRHVVHSMFPGRAARDLQAPHNCVRRSQPLAPPGLAAPAP